MDFIEYERELPDSLEVPFMRTKESLKEEEEDHPKDFSDRACYIGGVSAGFISLQDGLNLVKIDFPEALFKIMGSHRHIFLLLSLGQIDILWKGFSSAFQESIITDPNLWAKEYPWGVRRESPRKYSFVKGGKWHTLWFPQVEYKLTSDPSKIVDEYLRLETIGLSPEFDGIASIGRSFLFGPKGPSSYKSIQEEFYYSRTLVKKDKKTLQNLFNTCKRPPMACASLGNIPPSWNEDMRKAWNTALAHSPTASPYKTVLDESSTYNPEANHASYKVKVALPREWKFSPSLFRYDGKEGDYGVISPTGGPLIIRIGQNLAKLWTYLGIPFQVLTAWKLLPAGGVDYPFALRCAMLAHYIETYQKDFPHINLKLTYQAGISSFLTMYEFHNNLGEDKAKSLIVFNPIHQLFVYEWVFCNNWMRMMKHPEKTQQALRIDANTFMDYPGFIKEDDEIFKLDNSFPAPMFFPNAREKDKNLLKEAKYKNAVKEAADKGQDKVVLRKAMIGTLTMVLSKLIPLEEYGKDVYIDQIISLGGETREPIEEKYKKRILPKDLIDNQIYLQDPHLERK